MEQHTAGAQDQLLAGGHQPVAELLDHERRAEHQRAPPRGYRVAQRGQHPAVVLLAALHGRFQEFIGQALLAFVGRPAHQRPHRGGRQLQVEQEGGAGHHSGQHLPHHLRALGAAGKGEKKPVEAAQPVALKELRKALRRQRARRGARRQPLPATRNALPHLEQRNVGGGQPGEQRPGVGVARHEGDLPAGAGAEHGVNPALAQPFQPPVHRVEAGDRHLHRPVEHLPQPLVHGAVVVVVQVRLRVGLEDVVGGHQLAADLFDGRLGGDAGLVGEAAVDRDVVEVVAVIEADGVLPRRPRGRGVDRPAHRPVERDASKLVVESANAGLIVRHRAAATGRASGYTRCRSRSTGAARAPAPCTAIFPPRNFDGGGPAARAPRRRTTMDARLRNKLTDCGMLIVADGRFGETREPTGERGAGGPGRCGQHQH